MKKSKADKVKEDKQRLKDKIKRYEVLHPPIQQFKMEQAKKNYQAKMMQLKDTLEEREKRLDSLYRD